MSLTVTFTGRVPLATSGPNAAYQVWTYTVQPSSPTDLLTSQRLALAIPADVDVQDPRRFPDVASLGGAFLEHDASISRQYVGKVLSAPATGTQTISFVAPAGQADREVFLVSGATGRPWTVLPFAGTANGPVNNVQTLPAPSSNQRVFTGRPLADFTGTLPYASEVFGVYQPLAGWQGAQNTQRTGAALATFDAVPPTAGVLSPIGLVDLFRQYFFEFDTFLGAPAGHLWLSPGGTVEVIETSTRRTLTEQTAEQSEQVTRKSEESLTDQTDVADAIKEENANDTKLGASASAGANFAGIYHGDVSATFNNESTTKKSSEQTHKHSRTQSSKVSSEIVRNFKTTFRTVTEQTDTSSRRYVVQNTTDKLVNYELRRKMRKVGVQLQHLGSQLSWQVFLGAGTTTPGVSGDAPGRKLGLGEMVHVVPAPDVSSLHRPEAPEPLQRMQTTFTGTFPIRQYPGTTNAPHNDFNYTRSDPNSDEMSSDNNDDHIRADGHFSASPPAPGYVLRSEIYLTSAKTTSGADATFIAPSSNWTVERADIGTFKVLVDQVHFGGGASIALTVTLNWEPSGANPAQAAYEKALVEYKANVAEIERKAYAAAVHDRLGLVSKTRTRKAEDLRAEERQVVFADLIKRIQLFEADPHLGAELIRQIFDIDQMLYFVAPDYWRPDNLSVLPDKNTRGRYPAPSPVWGASDVDTTLNDPLQGETVVSWYSHTGVENAVRTNTDEGNVPEYRVNYLITEDTQPAPSGSSLGWLIQTDGDERRNEFLNAAWVKVVLPIRPGHELDALAWLKKAGVEGEAALDQPYTVQPGDPAEYQGKTIGQVLDLVAAKLQAANTTIANTLATEKVFETGFDPLPGGFRPADPFQIFDQWVEVLPTDQIVAVEVTYDPKTGQQR
ncbi:hypothetical protein [Amycolatopsis sp. H20-H5]|uniref:hypothetical protein n=1 Tax=Amycolatopsis sp. H20-H5 TaxID=3046309 RepID=UPI002DB56392|nr:hypothetical protein [Amycolatopsis sp. H20-H5]MEC3980668.1 hypothetical protein [Amycolatopsis sp. H20-H5]